MENPIKIDDLGVPLFSETSNSCHFLICHFLLAVGQVFELWFGYDYLLMVQKPGEKTHQKDGHKTRRK